jgi:7-cyano-7-deazaguanine reductase
VDSDKAQQDGLLLGRQVEYRDTYAPELLQPIERQRGRAALGLAPTALPFRGEDVWHAYELSWLEPDGRPVAAAGRLFVPADSPAIVESKSLKLYLNSLNNSVFESREQVRSILTADLSRAAGAAVGVELLACDDSSLAGVTAPGTCVDSEAFTREAREPAAALLSHAKGLPAVDDEETLHSHLLRSLCPVTAQPDWATLVVWMRGARVDRASLLRYVVSFRRHQEFHEQCVERIFCDLLSALAPGALSVQALYTRRGGLDISPWRSTEAGAAPRYRLDRQ